MEQTWYIKENDFHRGPYAEDEIFRLLKEKEIFEDTLLWKKGMRDWKNVSMLDEFSDVFPPEFVPEDGEDNLLLSNPDDLYEGVITTVNPIKEPIRKRLKKRHIQFSNEVPRNLFNNDALRIQAAETKPIEKEVEKQSFTSVESLVEEIREEELNVAINEFDADHERDQEESFPELEVQAEKEHKKGPSFLFKFVLGLIMFSVLTVCGGYFLWKKGQEAPAEISPKGAAKLTKVFRYLPWEPVKYTKYFDNKTKVLWVATNRIEKVKYQVEITSISKQVMSLSPIVATTTTSSQRHYIKMNQFKFQKGMKFKNGYYRLKMKALNKGEGFNYETRIFIGSDSKKEIDNQLKYYFDTLKKKLVGSKQSLSQQYQTLISVVKKTEEIFYAKLKGFRRGYHARRFEKAYAVEVSPVLAALVVDTRKLKAAQPIEFTAIKKEFDEVFDFGERFGNLVIKIVKDISGRKKVRKFNRKFLKNIYKEQFRLLRQDIYTQYEKVKRINFLQI